MISFNSLNIFSLLVKNYIKNYCITCIFSIWSFKLVYTSEFSLSEFCDDILKYFAAALGKSECLELIGYFCFTGTTQKDSKLLTLNSYYGFMCMFFRVIVQCNTILLLCFQYTTRTAQPMYQS